MHTPRKENMLKGIDVSHYQTNIDNYIKGLDFVIIKASEGKSMKDSKRLDHLKTAKDNKLLYGFYHYAHPELNTVASEVNNFLSCVPSECIGDCLLVLDWEGKALKENINWAYDFLNLVYKKTGVRPLIYCQASYTSKLSKIVKENFDFKPASIKHELKLLYTKYQDTAYFGHFGRTDLNLPWEDTNAKAQEISKAYAKAK